MERNEAIRIIRNHLPHGSFKMLREALETLIPELKESDSEDEKKLKESLMQYLWDMYHKDCYPPKPDIELCDKWIAWLEKQGQKPVNSDNVDGERTSVFKITQDQTEDWLKKYIDAGKQYKQKDPCKNCPHPKLNCSNFPCIEKKAFDLGKSVFECVKTEYEKTKQEPAWSDAEVNEDLFNYTNILSAEENTTLENLINKLAVSGIKQYNTQAATILFKK